MESIVSIKGLDKTFKSGLQALKGIDLEIRRGEIFALLGPNGAGKTTLIGVVCGLVQPTAGTVMAGGRNVVTEYREARANIGLVPQELATDVFGRVHGAIKFSRGLFGKAPNDAHVERVLKDLSLWDKRDSAIGQLSGGMKRRVLIAKALSHEPTILFLDEPTAGVDVELRRDMWQIVRRLRDQGVTIILTTHYIEEAEEMADRIGIIDQGRIVLVEDKQALIKKLGQTSVTIGLKQPLAEVPAGIGNWPVKLADDGLSLTVTVKGEGSEQDGGVAELVNRLAANGIDFKTIDMQRSSLEDIFVSLVGRRAT
ncbi:ABC transporter ATP-binding protein [soil metagenome]